MRNTRTYILVIFVLLLLICFGASVSGAQPLLEQPTVKHSNIRLGEVLKYNIKIRGIPAGTQTLRVNGKKLLHGYEVYHVESESKASKFFNIFYTFDDQSESFISIENLHPLRYQRKITDGGYQGSIFVDFDPVNRKARVLKNEERTELYVPEGIQDELSMIYLLRNKEIEVGRKYEFPALIGNKALKVGVSVLRTEKLETTFGTMKTIVLKTIPKDITMWLTHDSSRIPVKIEAQTKIGNLVSKLEEIH